MHVTESCKSPIPSLSIACASSWYCTLTGAVRITRYVIQFVDLLMELRNTVKYMILCETMIVVVSDKATVVSRVVALWPIRNHCEKHVKSRQINSQLI